MASPNTIKFKTELAARSAAKQAEMDAIYAESHPSIPRTSLRHMIARTKGLPFSRFKLLEVIPTAHNLPSVLRMKHPTKGHQVHKRATDMLVHVFFPRLPDNLRAALLGIA